MKSGVLLASGLCWINTPHEMGVLWRFIQRDEGIALVVVMPNGEAWEIPTPREIAGTPTALGILLASLLDAAA